MLKKSFENIKDALQFYESRDDQKKLFKTLLKTFPSLSSDDYSLLEGLTIFMSIKYSNNYII